MLFNYLTSATELLLVFLITSVFILYLQYRQRYKYWQLRGVKQLNPIFPVGDLSTAGLGITSIYTRIQYLYNEIKENNLNFAGIYFFNGPTFLPVSPDLINTLLIKDFNHFMDRGTYIDTEHLPITGHLFSMKGQQWKDLRAKLSPTFTPVKMKAFHKILIKNGEDLVEVLNESNHKEIEMKTIFRLFTIDTIANIVLGIDCNCLKNPNDKFFEMTGNIFHLPTWDLLKLIFQEGLHNPGNIVKVAHTKENLVNYITDLVNQTVKYRDQNRIKRDDFMQVMLTLRDRSELTMNDIVAQCYLFLMAGYDTTASTMTFAVHELAHNQQIQERVRDEILEHVGNDVSKFDFETIAKLPLLDKIVKETLRKYPVVPMLNRIVIKPYQIPGTDVTLEVGTPVLISLLALHRDPAYFPDPLKFDPARFDDNMPSVYMPFGDGPRYCIGRRLGEMEAKLGLAAMLSNFRLYAGANSSRELPIKTNSSAPVLDIESGISIKIVKV